MNTRWADSIRIADGDVELSVRELRRIYAFTAEKCRGIITYITTKSPQGGSLADDAFEAFIRAEVFRVFESMLGSSLKSLKDNAESTLDAQLPETLGELRGRMSDREVLEHIHAIDRDTIDDAQLKFLDEALLGVAHEVLEFAEQVVNERPQVGKGKV